MHKFIALFFFISLSLAVVFPLLSQEFDVDLSQEFDVDNEEQTELLYQEIIPEIIFDDNTVFIIDDFELDITGRTRPGALLYNGEFQKGEELRGLKALEEYILEKTQMVINQRVLKNNAEVTYSIGEQREDGAYPVTVNIKVEDTWNIVALPYPKYSTNTGFELIIKARDYNFLGSMSPLRIDIGYEYDEEKHNSFSLGIESNTPFQALGYTWYLRFDNIFSYRPQVEEPYYYKHVSGLSMELPFRTTTFTFGIDESLVLNEENSDRNKRKYGGGYDDFQSGLYMSTRLYTSWEIPTGLKVSRYGDLTYNPGISVTFNHELPEWPLQTLRKGPFMNFNHSLGFGKINWHGNYREGLSVSFNNSFNYNFYSLMHDGNPWSSSYRVRAIKHSIITDFLGISSRLQYRQWFYQSPNYYTEGGDVLRGIADKALTADYMLSLNMDFPLRALVITPSRWFNSKKMSVFDFEMYLSPIIDMALYHDPRTETSFAFRNIAVAGGMEFIVFPAFMRSLYARLSIGWNLREMFASSSFTLPTGKDREITFIIGHFY